MSAVSSTVPMTKPQGEVPMKTMITSNSGHHGITVDQLERLINRINAPMQQQTVSGLGNPGPLGLGSFAMTTFVLSIFNTGAFYGDTKLEGVVLPLALFYGGISQFAAGMWEYRVSNTFGATAFTSYGAFWLSFAAYVYFIAPNLIGVVDRATGLYLLAWMIFTWYMTVAAYKVGKVVFGVFFFLSITFFFLTVGAFSGTPSCTHAGGWFGLITAGWAWYGSAAVVINSTWGFTVLPVGVPAKPELPTHSQAAHHHKASPSSANHTA